MPGQKSCRVRSEKTDEADESGHTDAAATVSVARKRMKKRVIRTDTPSMRPHPPDRECQKMAVEQEDQRGGAQMIATGNGIFDEVTPQRLPMIQYSIEAAVFPDLP